MIGHLSFINSDPQKSISFDDIAQRPQALNASPEAIALMQKYLLHETVWNGIVHRGLADLSVRRSHRQDYYSSHANGLRDVMEIYRQRLGGD